ncbi:MAG: PTS sugar transporter subunit IIA [Geminicoccaceae bacterium]
MIGLVVVGHNGVPASLVKALEQVAGPQESVAAICILADDDMEKRRDELLELVRACDSGSGVVVLTDMFGGTPSNLALSIMGHARIEVLAGANLPLLLKLASVRNKPIDEAVRLAQEAGRKHIMVASQILSEQTPRRASGL